MTEPSSRRAPRIGIALGSGAARGLAHIPYIEALEELGVRPSVIAGTSIGALIGAGWASGMSGSQIREHAFRVLGTFRVIAGRLWMSLPPIKGVLQSRPSIQVDPLMITNAFLPEGFADDFAALAVPFRAAATDLHSGEPTAFQSGPLRQAIAASIAMPALFRPVAFNGRTYIDGGVTHPLPLNLASPDTDILIGIDVTGDPHDGETPEDASFVDVGIAATRIMGRMLIRFMMERYPPDIYVRAPVDPFGTMEFWRVREIAAAADVDKDRFKQAVAAKIAAYQSAPPG
jgi:NTE family protein